MTHEYTMILSFLYILAIAIIYCPCKVETTENNIQYFPEIDDEPMNPSPAPVAKMEILPIEPTAIATVTPLEALEGNELEVIATVTTSPVTDLKTLTSKELKRMARTKKIPRYGSLTKNQLLIALA